jgi:hypothetical protein
MDIGSQILMGVLRKFEALEHHLQEGLQDIRDNCHNIQRTLASMQERYLMADIRDEYNQEVYAWYDFEADCDDWYMDSCHFWDDNHFHILFDDSTPPSVENINVTNQEPIMITKCPSCIFYSGIIPSRFNYDPFPLCGWIFLFGST